MRVRCLTTGVVRGKRRARGLRRYLPGGWREETLPVNAFLIEHPDGACLFDAGQSSRASGPGYLPQWHPFLRLSRFELAPEDEAAAQVGAAGIDAADVRWVVLSHLHTDHVGGVGGFPAAEVIVSAAEWARARGVAGRIRGYLPQHWPAALSPRLVRPDGDSVGPFPSSFDVAGDGRLLLVPTPGHTPGHVSLLVRNGTSYLCAGDLAATAEDLVSIAPEVAAFCREEGIVFLGAHDPSACALAAHGR
jgi:glyoxylase-like metal-dependent hydrolase (beta-lactamase superfamily II)